MSVQAKLAAALRRPDDYDQPPPVPELPKPSANDGVMQLKKSNLYGTVTWEQMLEKLSLNSKHDFTECTATITKMFRNVLINPTEPKFRKIRHANPNFTAKVYSCRGAPELYRLAGFKSDSEEGFLILPESADLSLLQKAIDALAAQAVVRQEAEEKKRKLDLEKAAKARAERQQKKKDEAAPDAVDAG